MLSLRDCFNVARKEYPRHYPYAFFEYGHYCYVQLNPKRRKGHVAPDEHHRIDRITGEMSGYINIMDILDDPALIPCLKQSMLVADYLRDHPARYGGTGSFHSLERVADRLLYRFGLTGKNRITIHMRRETE